MSRMGAASGAELAGAGREWRGEGWSGVGGPEQGWPGAPAGEGMMGWAPGKA